MSRRVALVIIGVSEELSASFIRVTRIGELETTIAVTSNRRTLRRNVSRTEPLLFFQVASHLSSRGLIGPRIRPTAKQKIW
jgi:hypothetical protein